MPRSPLFRILAALAIIALCACGPISGGDPPDAGPTPVDARIDTSDSAPPPEYVSVYAHSATTLYRLDPETLAPSTVGDFTFDGDAVNITDIALNRDGEMIAISLGEIFAVDRTTAHATKLADSSEFGFTSLSFVPDPANPQNAEILISANFAGEVYRIDPNTGISTLIGDYGVDNQGRDIGSSGDIVSVIGFGTVATVNVEDEPNDFIAWINPTTFEASLIGDTGFDRIFGVGFWRGTVYGFTDNAEFLTIDVESNGQADYFASSVVEWWGAGVSTIAPIIE